MRRFLFFSTTREMGSEWKSGGSFGLRRVRALFYGNRTFSKFFPLRLQEASVVGLFVRLRENNKGFIWVVNRVLTILIHPRE
jgi:hypothetical protein